MDFQGVLANMSGSHHVCHEHVLQRQSCRAPNADRLRQGLRLKTKQHRHSLQVILLDWTFQLHGVTILPIDKVLQVCAAGPGLLQKLGRVLKEKAQGDLDRVFSGTSKTRERLGVCQ